MTWIQTLTGKRFDLLNPTWDSIHPGEISTVLSRICRFGGHCVPFYSVAQHSVLVCDLVEDECLKLPALLHDAHEAYWGFGDVCRPAKRMDADLHRILERLAARVDRAIAYRFGFDPVDFVADAIHHADNVALATEARAVMVAPPCPWEELPPPSLNRIVPLSMEDAFRLFNRRLDDLWSEESL